MAAKIRLAQKKEREAEFETRIRKVFQTTNKQLEEVKRAKKQKRKTPDELLSFVYFDTDILRDRIIRPANDYINRSFNLDRQVDDLISHLYVKYKAPYFLTQSLRKDRRIYFSEDRELFHEWFISLTQGGSFPKLVKGIMTSKEAHIFLRAPWYAEIHENVWWAKLVAAGLPQCICYRLVKKVFAMHPIHDTDERLAETITFYSNHHKQMGAREFDKVSRFIEWILRSDSSFRMKGRTASSMIKFANEWHRSLKAEKSFKFKTWQGMGLENWQYVTPNNVYDIIELKNNRDLLLEGRKQRHCVYDYVESCIDDESSIFSMRVSAAVFNGEFDQYMRPVFCKLHESSRITIEVNRELMQIEQCRGHLNRSPNDDEKTVIKMWAREQGFRFCNRWSVGWD